MSRNLIVLLPGLEDSLRSRIREAAESAGFLAAFPENEAEAAPLLPDAEIIFSLSSALADSAPRLRWQCTPSAGFNQFASCGAFLSGRAMLSNSSGAYGVTLAEHILMLTLEMLRRQPEYAEIVRRREWTNTLPVRSIKGSRVTLLGTGDIGQEAAVRLRAFAPARLSGVNRGGRNPSGLFDTIVPISQIESILPGSDILILSLPGTAETDGLLDAKRLSLLPDGALVVNVGRGTVIDQLALERELRAGRLYAALDVFEREPIPADASLWDCPNLLITPHAAGGMSLPHTRERIVSLFLRDFDNYCAGRPLEKRVDLAKGY